MEEEKSLLKKMAEMFSDDDDEENVSEEIMALARAAEIKCSRSGEIKKYPDVLRERRKGCHEPPQRYCRNR